MDPNRKQISAVIFAVARPESATDAGANEKETDDAFELSAQ
jgi:hypothetical protein